MSSQQHLVTDSSFRLHPHNQPQWTPQSWGFTWSSELGTSFPQRASFQLHRTFFLGSDIPNLFPLFFSSREFVVLNLVIRYTESKHMVYIKITLGLESIGFYIFFNMTEYNFCIFILSNYSMLLLSGSDLLLWNSSGIPATNLFSIPHSRCFCVSMWHFPIQIDQLFIKEKLPVSDISG